MAGLDVTRWAKEVFRDVAAAGATPSETGRGGARPLRAGVRAAARRLRHRTEAGNMRLMQTLDDAWNDRDWDTFERLHAEQTIVRWPGQPPTHGIRAHRAEGVQMFKTFPDNRVENRPYKRKDELVQKKVIPGATYDKIKDHVIAKQSTAGKDDTKKSDKPAPAASTKKP